MTVYKLLEICFLVHNRLEAFGTTRNLFMVELCMLEGESPEVMLLLKQRIKLDLQQVCDQ